MSDHPATDGAALVRAEADVRRLRKQEAYWRGRVSAELNKLARAEYVKATAPQSDAAFLICEVTLQNFRVSVHNYQEIALGFAAQMRKAKEALATLQGNAS